MLTKPSWAANGDPGHRHRHRHQRVHRLYILTVSALGVFCFTRIFSQPWLAGPSHDGSRPRPVASPYGSFPQPDDPFHFQPCTNVTLPPALDDDDPGKTWAALFNPDPDSWSWANETLAGPALIAGDDPFAGRGIYLCGYMDVPLDYTNASETRVVRLAVNKLQVSGLKRLDGLSSPSSAGIKSQRTIVLNPGGPGGSGVSYVWRTAESVTRRLSAGAFDVLSWDPRGVNATQPAISCFPYDADRDHWSVLRGQYRESCPSPRAQLEVGDVMNDAVFRACWERHGDLPRFMTTASVARDLEQIRLALEEDELTGYLVSYGTGIGQTYVNMFPSSAGRVILDGTEYVRDGRRLGGFGWTALDNATDAWHDGFIGECLDAGPDHCALARAVDGEPVTVESLEQRMDSLLSSLPGRPMPGYTDFSGPTLITYSGMVGAIYGALYNAESWPALAQMLYELEGDNTTLAARFLEGMTWEYDPSLLRNPGPPRPSTDELGDVVICGDSYDDPEPAGGLDWWESLWANMTADNWIAGNSRFYDVFPCRHFTKYWPEPSEVYRGDLGKPLRHPVLLIAETYDPATPLRNGRRLLSEMGDSARMVVHHGYGHSSRDRSDCTDEVARRYITEGVLPDEAETACYANEKPYRYGVNAYGARESQDPVQAWYHHIEVLEGLKLR